MRSSINSIIEISAGKKVVASQPPSDEDYDTGDNWSTASVLSEDVSSVSDDGLYIFPSKYKYNVVSGALIVLVE